MDRVARLLRETERPLTEIAARSGFESAEYLSVAFKKYTGVSPRTYRRQMRTNSAKSHSAEPSDTLKSV
jgi:LacI family transcriptional regulator, galactose operon repressor